MKELKGLDYDELFRHSGRIACPFSRWFKGKVNYDATRTDREIGCKLACGKLFPRAYQERRCPCWYLSRTYVKRVFWKKLRKAHGKEE